MKITSIICGNTKVIPDTASCIEREIAGATIQTVQAYCDECLEHHWFHKVVT